MAIRIAVFDYYVSATNPIGSCHLELLRGMSGEHEFVVFAVRFENPDPGRITWIRVPVPTRPLALLFLAYHVIAPACYALYRLRGGKRFDVVQMVESNLLFGDLAYTHFCHRAFLRTDGRPRPLAGIRSFLRWCDHKLHASLEPSTYRRVKEIVVPSEGLAGELQEEYPQARGKVIVLPNHVDVENLRLPADLDAPAYRAALGFEPDDVVCVFVALGHFERKGLPLLLEAIDQLREERLKLLVVGGEGDVIRSYQRTAKALNIEERVRFAGMQRDVRPFLQIADVFALPSAYEAFPLVALEAAAAGLPLIVTAVHGVREFVRDGSNGFLVDRNVLAIAGSLRRFMSMSAADRQSLGRTAQEDVNSFTPERFVASWRELYSSWQRRQQEHGAQRDL